MLASGRKEGPLTSYEFLYRLMIDWQTGVFVTRFGDIGVYVECREIDHLATRYDGNGLFYD